MKIRDSRLYREQYGTFEEYCKEKWGMSKTHANRLISSTEVTDNLTPIGVIPKTESQVRPLTKLEPAEQKEAWDKAVKTAPEGYI
ncbi:MAG: hypothetical protein NTU69_11745 [Proteobacteria bacterium]|nr:hypothetical protein [Pseudomonadota bacterium]